MVFPTSGWAGPRNLSWAVKASVQGKGGEMRSEGVKGKRGGTRG